MSIFLIPQTVVRDIERVISRYWWSSQSKNGKGIHWLSWERLCRHKLVGGLGFRDFKDFNLALLRKQAWRFLTRPESLVSRLYKARYFHSSNFLGSPLGNNPSFVWRSVWETKSLIQEGARWCVGNGENIQISGQPWLNEEINPYITSVSPAFENQTVSSLMIPGIRAWDVDVVRDLFNDRDQGCIERIILPDN